MVGHEETPLQPEHQDQPGPQASLRDSGGDVRLKGSR